MEAAAQFAGWFAPPVPVPAGGGGRPGGAQPGGDGAAGETGAQTLH